MQITITKKAAEELGITDLVVMKKEVEFLYESNLIENVRDKDSLMQALHAWSYLKHQKELTPGVILKTHKTLMLHQDLRPDEKGYLRRCDVQVGGQIKLSWKSVPFALKEFTDRVRLITGFKYKKKDAETMSRSLHVQYEDIHPFVDGNGRTGRMFMNWIRLNVLKLPILIIKEQEKYEYYRWFE